MILYRLLRIHFVVMLLKQIKPVYTLQSRTPALVFEHVNNTDFKVNLNLKILLLIYNSTTHM